MKKASSCPQKSAAVSASWCEMMGEPIISEFPKFLSFNATKRREFWVRGGAVGRETVAVVIVATGTVQHAHTCRHRIFFLAKSYCLSCVKTSILF